MWWPRKCNVFASGCFICGDVIRPTLGLVPIQLSSDGSGN